MRLFGCITPGMILSALFSGAVAVAAFVLLAQDGLLHRATGLDFHYLRSWVALAAILFLLGQIAEMAREVLVSRGVPLPPDPGGEDESEQSQGPAGAVPSSARVAAVLKSVLGECGRLALVIGAMVAIPQLPAIVSDRPGWPNVESIAPYLQSLNSLAVWTAVFSVFLIAVRGASEIWPTVARALPYPWEGSRFSRCLISSFPVAACFRRRLAIPEVSLWRLLPSCWSFRTWHRRCANLRPSTFPAAPSCLCKFCCLLSTAGGSP